MVDFDYSRLDWIKAESELLKIMMALQLRFDTALKAAQRCQRLKTESRDECMIRLDTALDQARELENLIDEYIKTLNKMKELAQKSQK